MNINYFVNHNYKKILKYDWPSTVLISALKDTSTRHTQVIGRYPPCCELTTHSVLILEKFKKSQIMS